MTVPQISALTRAAEVASADDPAQQGLLMMRVRELEKLMRDAKAADLAICLQGAASLAELLSQEGQVTRQALHETTCIILRAVELAFSGGAPEPVADLAKGRSSLPLINDMVLGEILFQLGHVTEHQLRVAVALQQQTGRRIGDILVDSQVVGRDIVEAACRIQKRLREESKERAKPTPAPPKTPPAEADRATPTLTIKRPNLRVTEPPAPPEEDSLRRKTNDYLLGQILIQMGLVKASQVERASRDARASGARIGESLVAAGACRWSEIERAVKVQTHLRLMTGTDRPAVPAPRA